MTDDEIRIAVAECCGWIPELRRAEIPEADFVHEETFWRKGDQVSRSPWLPNYPADLNACAEMEKTINEEQQRFEYWRQLHNVTKPEGYEPRPGCDAHTWGFITATARQRAEAFLRMKLLWKP